MRYPYTTNAIPICTNDEKAGLGGQWKAVLSRFVNSLSMGGFARLRDEERTGLYVYDKANVAVFVTRHGIPSIRGVSGHQPNASGVASLKSLWDQAKRAVAACRQEAQEVGR